MNGSLSSDRPLEHVSTDILGPFKHSLFQGLLDGGKFWILTMTGLYSRWTELAVLTTISGYSVTDAFYRTWSHKHVYPHRIHSDRGTQFISVDFQDYCTANRIGHTMASPYNPTSNGVSKRSNPTITLLLRMHKNRPISKVLNILNYRLSTVPSHTTALSPYELLHGYSPIDPLRRDCSDLVPEGMARRQADSTKSETTMNARRKPHSFPLGPFVFIRVLQNKKLDSTWKGPF